MSQIFQNLRHLCSMNLNIKKKVNNPTTNLLVHVIFWLLFTHIIFDISGLYRSFTELYEEQTFIDEAFILLPMMIGLFYWNSHFLIPRFLNQKSWKQYLLYLTFSFFFFIALGYGIDQFLDSLGFEFNLHEEEMLDFLAQFNILVIGISTSLGVSKIAMENTSAKKAAQAKQKAAELKYLIAQVNPHFLHNTLNTIYSLANDENAPTTQDAILKLSKMMRYMVKESSQEKVPLKQEIAFLNNFIDLQKLRLAGAIPVDFSINGPIDQQKIAPLLLITLIENVFKHGVQYQPVQPIKISILVEKSNQLILTTQNVLKSKGQNEHTGTGLDNLQKRLNMIYPNTHQLEITTQHQLFLVYLRIDL